MGCRTFMNRHSPGVASCVGSWITTKNKDFLKFNRNVSGTPHLTENSAGSNVQRLRASPISPLTKARSHSDTFDPRPSISQMIISDSVAISWYSKIRLWHGSCMLKLHVSPIRPTHKPQPQPFDSALHTTAGAGAHRSAATGQAPHAMCRTPSGAPRASAHTHRCLSLLLTRAVRSA